MNLETRRKELIKKKGRVKGSQIKCILDCIKKKEGSENFIKLRQELEKYELSFDIDKINHFDWVNEGESVFIILLAKNIFNWSNEDIFNIGKNAGKKSFLLGLFARYFISIDVAYNKAPEYWKKHFDFGEVEMVELNKKEKYMTFRVHGYDYGQVMCEYFFSGYFYSLATISLGEKNLDVKETKCVHKGDDYNEYIISW